MELPAEQWMNSGIIIIIRSKTSLEKLPPTNHAIKAHIVRVYYATYVMTSILSANTIELNPLLYGFEEEDERLHPDKAIRPIPEEYAVHCTCLKCATEIYVHVERVTCLVARSSSSKVWETRRFAVKIQLVVSKTEQNSYVTLTAAWKCTPGIYMYSLSHYQIGMIWNSDYSQKYTFIWI